MLLFAHAVWAAAAAFSKGGGFAGGGQSCDAVNICASGTCPTGMTKVARPERSDVCVCVVSVCVSSHVVCGHVLATVAIVEPALEGCDSSITAPLRSIPAALSPSTSPFLPPSLPSARRYTIRTAQGTLSADPTSYVPGETVSIFVSVVKQRIAYRKSAGKNMCFCDMASRSNGFSPHACGVPFVPKGADPDDPPVVCTEQIWAHAKYIGLLLYAVDANEEKVGTWEIPHAEPAMFWTPPDAMCGGVAVMHASATPKNYVHELVYRAPAAAGLGVLTFRALLKHGSTNMGAFYWPTAPSSGANKTETPVDRSPSGDLTLAEALAPPSPQAWFRATAAGQSCDDVCEMSGSGQVCDLAAIQAVGNDPAALRLATRRFFSENAPALVRCASSSPALSDTPEKWLFFHKTMSSANTCASNELSAPSCAAVPVEDAFKLRRLCPCKAGRRRLTLRPPHSLPRPSVGKKSAGVSAGCPKYTPPAGRRRLDGVNTAASLGAVPLAASLAFSALVVLSGAGQRETALLSLAFLAASELPRAAAHNWQYNPPSRSRGGASTMRPCRPRRSHIPHVQVNPGQTFEAEWSTGHPGDGAHMFTVVKASDQQWLHFVSKALIDDYIDSALPSMHWTPKAHWDKRHLSYNSSSGKKGSDNVRHELEGKVLMDPSTDLDYIHRAEAFTEAGGPFHNQWTYTSVLHATDASVAYTNPQ